MKNLQKAGIFDDFSSSLMVFCSLFNISALKYQMHTYLEYYPGFFETPDTPGGTSIVERKNFHAKRPLWRCGGAARAHTLWI